jgi:hypothetical protein
MLGRLAAVGGLCLLVAGCLTGQPGSEYASAGQAAGWSLQGQTRIVIMSVKDPRSHGTSCDTRIDGVALTRLLPGTFVSLDLPAGPHHLAATRAMFPGDTTLDFPTEPGKTYYFLILPSERSRAVQSGGRTLGLAGMAVMAVASSGADNKGPVEFVPLQEGQARSVMATLLQAE